MNRDPRSIILGFVVLFTVVGLANIMFWGLTTFVIFTVLQWMGVL
jgi:hypothetical protein